MIVHGLADSRRAIDHAYSIGQTKRFFVYKRMAVGTIEKQALKK